MAHTGQRLRGLVLGACAAVVMAWPTAAIGQAPYSSSAEPPSDPPDFMLERPRVTLGLRGNWVFASAGSDIYDFVTELLTIEKSSFNTPAIGGEVSLSITPRLDVSVGIEHSNESIDSEYRDQVERLPDGSTAPILQSTSLKHSNLYGSARFALRPRGRQISRLAWIPSSFVPYVGAGVGISKYRFQQDGDFVNFVNNQIFADFYKSEGWTPSFHVLGGTDIHVYKRVFASLEGRYMWADAPLHRKFVGFDPIDLGGFRFGAGLNFVF